MELLYVWVEEYGNIKKQGFNFSPNYDFEVKEQENGEYTLVDNFETSGKKKQPENFFGDIISNITAIVGKNGSGKSTLLNLLNQSNTPRIIFEYLMYSCIFVYKIKDELKIESFNRKLKRSPYTISNINNINDNEFENVKYKSLNKIFYFDEFNHKNTYWRNKKFNSLKFIDVKLANKKNILEYFAKNKESLEQNKNIHIKKLGRMDEVIFVWEDFKDNFYLKLREGEIKQKWFYDILIDKIENEFEIKESMFDSRYEDLYKMFLQAITLFFEEINAFLNKYNIEIDRTLINTNLSINENISNLIKILNTEVNLDYLNLVKRFSLFNDIFNVNNLKQGFVKLDNQIFQIEVHVNFIKVPFDLFKKLISNNFYLFMQKIFDINFGQEVNLGVQKFLGYVPVSCGIT